MCVCVCVCVCVCKYVMTRCWMSTLEGTTMHTVPNVVLNNEGSTVQNCRNTNVHVVNTDVC